jgi:hypothetical protein
MNTQIGGVKIIIPPNPPLTKPEIKTEITEDIFFQVFSENNVESVEIVSLSGVSGIVLSVTLKDSPFKSSYVNEDGSLSTSIDFLNPQTGKVYKKVILKYCIVKYSDPNDPSNPPVKYIFNHNGIKYRKYTVYVSEFNTEYEIQKKIFRMTMETSGNPTCPDPFGKFIFKRDQYNPSKISPLLYDKANLLTDIDIPDCDIGIIVMESLQDDFLTSGQCMDINDDAFELPDPPPDYLEPSQPMSSKKKLYESLSLFFIEDAEHKNNYINLQMIEFALSVIVTTLWKSGIMTYDGHSNNFLVDLSFFDGIITHCDRLPYICKHTNPNDIKMIDLGRVKALFLTDEREVYTDIDGYIEFFFSKLTPMESELLCKMFVIFFGKYEPSIKGSRTDKERLLIQSKKLDLQKITYIDIQKLFRTEIHQLNELIKKDTEKLGEALYSDEGSENIVVDETTSEEMTIDSGMMLIHRLFFLSFFIDYFINYYMFEIKVHKPQSFHLFIPLIGHLIRYDKTTKFPHDFFYRIVSSNKFRIDLKSFIKEQKPDFHLIKIIIIFYKNIKENVKMMMKPNLEERGTHKESFLKGLIQGSLGSIYTPRGQTRSPTERELISSEFDKFISGYGPIGGPEEVLPKKFLLPPLRPRPSSSMRPSEMSIPPSIPKLPDAIRAADSIAGRTSRSSLKPLPLAFSSPVLSKYAVLPPINESVNSSGGSRYRKLNMKQKIKQKNNNNKTKKNILRIVRNKRRRKSKKIIKYNYKKVMKTKKINKNK